MNYRNFEDAFDAYNVASSESDENDFYESKKSARKSIKESELDVRDLNSLKNRIDSFVLSGKRVPSDLMKEYKKLIKLLGNSITYSDSKNEWVMAESKKSARKSLKESFEYDGAIPLVELMEILDDEWKHSNTGGIFSDSSHWDDESRNEGKYIDISAIINFNSASNRRFNNKRVQKLYDDECNKVYKEVDEDYDAYDDVLNEYEPILFVLTIDWKELLVYADVDLGNGLGSTEVARERLADNEKDFRKQIQRMIDSF